MWFPVIIVLIGAVSWCLNLLLGNADLYSFLFWLISYLPNFLLTILVITYSVHLDFYKIYKVYKFLVYIQSLLLIFSSIKYGVHQVGDAAVGTVGDANFVAFHILVVILYEIISISVKLNRERISTQKMTLKFLEIFYFFIVFIIPESTANFGFLLIIVSFFLLKEYVLRKLNIIKITLITGIALLGSVFLSISNQVSIKRISGVVDLISDLDFDKISHLSKFNIYKKIITGEIINGESLILGLGPSTFTSRSSVIRMPEERLNDFALDLPYFKSDHFATFISPIYSNWRRTKESHGNFASPQTSVVSISVELGLLGLCVFFSYFFLIFKRIKTINLSPKDEHLRKFAFYFSVFFIINLFYLNFWEYPFMSFTYIIFTFLILFPKKD
ncbi:MAG: hypothetical protein OXH57_07390 [Ekhidna sp.]|nr:hypothetical protein [Ekhidna sp.]